MGSAGLSAGTRPSFRAFQRRESRTNDAGFCRMNSAAS
jgi:hypothetical protein